MVAACAASPGAVIAGEGEGEGDAGEGEGDAAEGEGEGDAGEGEGDAGEGEGDAGEGEGEGEGEGDAAGTFDAPIVIGAFPFHDARDTTSAASSDVDSYACAPDTDESGPEFVYTFTVTERGSLAAHVVDDAQNGVDVDVHLLDGPTGDACLARANNDLDAVLDPGSYFLVVDTYFAGGAPQAGPYVLDVDYHAFATGNCATVDREVRMFWSSCDPGIANCVEHDGGVFLRTPAQGPVVEEAHLATVDDGFGSGWPTSFTDGIQSHYALSQAATGFDMQRDQPWAPAGEGGSAFGEGATGHKLPVLDEAWYINMYWRDRPTGGTRMIVRNPANGRAVVASAGWETGPGANDAVAGVTEEVHHWLGTGHRDVLEIGFAVDDTLPLGPIECTP